MAYPRIDTMNILKSRLGKLDPIQLLLHVLCMFVLGVLWMSTLGIVVINPKVVFGMCWEIKIFLLYFIQHGDFKVGYPQNGMNFGGLFTVWGIISRYWWLSIAPTSSLIYFTLTRKK